MGFKATGYESLEKIQLDQDKDQWRGLISNVMEDCVPYNTGNSEQLIRPSASQEIFCPIEVVWIAFGI
jgi:hypothetical protein